MDISWGIWQVFSMAGAFFSGGVCLCGEQCAGFSLDGVDGKKGWNLLVVSDIS